MSETGNGRVNGHRSLELIEAAKGGAALQEPLDVSHISFDIDARLRSIVGVETQIDSDAHTAPYLGTHREGSGIVIDDQGLVLTIGYLILETGAIWLSTQSGERLPADFVGYDFETGFGLVRARDPLHVAALPMGASADLRPGHSVIIAARGGRPQSMTATVASVRRFCGYWEYMLDDAIYTVPAHPNWSGAALIMNNGRLAALGSLMVENAVDEEKSVRGNMFIPIDHLTPILDDLVRNGRANRPSRPWLGIFTAESDGQLVIAQVSAGGPADSGGLASGDIVIKINGDPVDDLADLYLKLWDSGPAGIPVSITVMRGDHVFDVTLRSTDRYAFFQTPRP